MRNFMRDGVISNINVDEHILNALKEDITYEDVTTMAIMQEAKEGTVQLICKETGILAGLPVFKRGTKRIKDKASRYKKNDTWNAYL